MHLLHIAGGICGARAAGAMIGRKIGGGPRGKGEGFHPRRPRLSYTVQGV